MLKCFDRNWQPKVTVISKSKDLSIITTAALFGELREHEIQMQRLSGLETSEKKVKPIALKASSKKSDETEEEVIFLRIVMLESMIYLRELSNGSQKDLERHNHVGPKLSKGTM